MERELTPAEIEDIIDFVQPSVHLPVETARSITTATRRRLHDQLVGKRIQPKKIPKLKRLLYEMHTATIIHPGESVGIVCAQSIGERQTQMSCCGKTQVLVAIRGERRHVPIGDLVDRYLPPVTNLDQHDVAPVVDLECVGVSPTEKVSWAAVTHVSRHPANGDLVTVTTKYGRTVRATASHSFLVRANNRVVTRSGGDLVTGDYVPVVKDMSSCTSGSSPKEFGRLVVPGVDELVGRFVDKHHVTLQMLIRYRGCADRLGASRELLAEFDQAIHADVWWDRVVGIDVERGSREMVYDFTVDEKLQSFMLSNGVFVHNTLNSVRWDETLLYALGEGVVVEPIGQMIDDLIQKDGGERSQLIPENRTVYLSLPEGYRVPSSDEDGVVAWHRVEAVTRHLPVGDLVRVRTMSGRNVTATRSKSFLVWKDGKFVTTKGSAVAVGDRLPTTRTLPRPFDHPAKPFDELEGSVLGYVLAAGRLLGGGRILVTGKRHEAIELYCRVRRVFCMYVAFGDGVKVEFCLCLWSASLCGLFSGDSHSLGVPNTVHSGSPELQRGFLRGFFDVRGTVTVDTVRVNGPDKNVLLRVASVASHFGVFCSVEKSGLVVRDQSVQRFETEIDFASPPRRCQMECATRFVDKDQMVVLDEVVSVEGVPTADGEWVYDLTVADTRNFQLLNGITMRDTFHKAGQSEKAMTAGVPRFQELMGATKNPKIVNCKVYFRQSVETIQEMRRTVGHSIVGLLLKDVSLSMTAMIKNAPEPWYAAHDMLHGDTYRRYIPYCISVQLNTDKLFEHRLTTRQIAAAVTGVYSDLYCVFGPPTVGRLDIYVDISTVVLPERRLYFINSENAPMIYLEECVMPTLEKLVVAGIPGISEIYYIRENGEWIVETNGANLRKLLSLGMVDPDRTLSNNVWDIYEIFGIEAARQFLIEEYMSIMDGINICHTSLLVDYMTHSGTISSITRYTLKKESGGPFGRASFEESMICFTGAGVRGELEPTVGVSSAIICGKRAHVGTGMFGVRWNLGMLPDAEDVMLENVVERTRDLSLDDEEGRPPGRKKVVVPSLVEF